MVVLLISLLHACSLEAGARPPSAVDGALDAGADTSTRDGAENDVLVPPSDSALPDACSAGSTSCTDGVVIVCGDDGRVAESRVCPLGCSATGAERCAVLVPSNVPPLGASGSDDDVIIESARDIDTTACDFTDLGSVRAVDQLGGGEACVWNVGSLTLTSTGDLTVTGQRPLILVARRTVDVGGSIDVSARGTAPGPGGASGGPNSIGPGGGAGGGQEGEHGTGNHDGGGAGGGACGGGGAGGAGDDGRAPGGSGGSAFLASDELSPLVGGSGGGTGPGTASLNLPGRGGAGGGALQISASEAIVVGGVLLAGGGGGAGGRFDNCSGNWGSGGGGGSGGAILLEAPTVTFEGGRALATGGGGGGASEWTSCTGSHGQNGQDGRDADGRAVGGTVTGGRGGAGGLSGGADTLEGAEGGSHSVGDGGGGGGGAGCILIRNADGTLPSSLEASPSIGPGLRSLPVNRS